MDFEKAYKEALERARKLKEMYPQDAPGYEEVFPELRESEDERTLDEIITALKYANHDGTYTKHIAYLEKHQKSLHISETCKENANSFIDEDERIRKEIVNFILYKVGHLLDEETEHKFITYLEEQKEQPIPLFEGNPDGYFDEWNQQHANPTKRECFEEGMRYAERLLSEHTPLVKEEDYSGMDDVERVIHRGFLAAQVHNVSRVIIEETAKEVRGILQKEQEPFQDGYIYPKFRIGDTLCRHGWADHTIESIYVCKDPVYVCKNDEGLESHILLSEQDEWELKQKPAVPVLPCSAAWFEDAEQKPAEWSEEDEDCLSTVIWCFEKFAEGRATVCIQPGDAKAYLKVVKNWKPESLKSPKPNWKPSEEQMKALESCFCEFGEGYPDEDGLRLLYNDLKKQMEQS